MSRALPRESETRCTLHARARPRCSGTGRTIKSVIACNCRSYVFVFDRKREGEGVKGGGGTATTVGLNTLANIANCLMNIYDVPS